MVKFFKKLFGRRSKTVKFNFTGNKVGVVHGIKYVDKSKYFGWDGFCSGTLFDARRWKNFCSDQELSIVKLENNQCTKSGCKKAIRTAIEALPLGGLLMVYYSGHGGQMRDISGDEADGKDETLCLYDGQMSDDVLGEMFSSVPDNVTVFFVTDCCNSRTLARGNKPPVVEAMEHNEFNCNMIHFAGCDDGTSSYGSNRGGVFTNALLETYKVGMTYGEWFDSAKKAMKHETQIPFMTIYGKARETDIAFGV